MNKDFTRDVEHAVDYLRQHWVKRQAPSSNALGRAKRLVYTARQLREPADDALQVTLDQLHGLCMWGELVLTVARIDPAWIAVERRERREHAEAGAAWLEDAQRRRRAYEAAEADLLKWGGDSPDGPATLPTSGSD